MNIGEETYGMGECWKKHNINQEKDNALKSQKSFALSLYFLNKISWPFRQ